jgi:4-carboxymuconolactone decarboxylase
MDIGARAPTSTPSCGPTSQRGWHFEQEITMDDKRTLGLAKFKEMSPMGAEKIRVLLEDEAPGTYTHVLEVAFGDLYQRKNLDPKIRQTVSLVALAAAGHGDLLLIHIDIARKLGFTKGELSEVFQQMVPFTGFPGSMLGIRVLKEAFGEG